MGPSERSQSNTSKYIQGLARLIRITSRWQIKRIKRAWRKFDATKGMDSRAKTRQWVNTARVRGGVEVREFSEDARLHFVNIKPQFRVWVQRVSNRAELIAQNLSNTVRYATWGTVLVLVMLGVIWLSGSPWNDVSPTMLVESEENYVGTGAVADFDDDDWGDAIGRTPNDDRSDSLNPNNDAYQHSMDNRSNQMNPNNDAYYSSRR